MDIHIPGWLFCGPFWLGFRVAVVLGVCFCLWVISQMGPRF